MVLAKPEEKKKYVKQEFEDGVFRIRQQLNELLAYELKLEKKNGGTYFSKMKIIIDKYIKIFVDQEKL